METLWKLAYATTATALVIVFYLVCCIVVRLKRWFMVLRTGSDRVECVTEAQPVAPSTRKKYIKTMTERHALARSMVVQYLLCSSFSVGIFMRCLAYPLLLAVGYMESMRGCHLTIQFIILLSGVEMVYVYVIFWRRQRYLYFDFGWKPAWLSTVSWSALALMTVASMVRLTMEMATWRYGPQYEVTVQGCVSLEYSTSYNVTWVEWQLPNLYKITANSVIAFYMLSLYACLCVKFLCARASTPRREVQRPNNQRGDELPAETGEDSVDDVQADTEFGATLIRVTACATVAFTMPVIVPIIWLKVLPPRLPAVLIYQVDDCGLILQTISMIVSINDWKETLRLRRIVQ